MALSDKTGTRLQIVGLLLAVGAIVVTLLTPELRVRLGLRFPSDDQKPEVVEPKVRGPEVGKPTSGTEASERHILVLLYSKEDWGTELEPIVTALKREFFVKVLPWDEHMAQGDVFQHARLSTGLGESVILYGNGEKNAALRAATVLEARRGLRRVQVRREVCLDFNETPLRVDGAPEHFGVMLRLKPVESTDGRELLTLLLVRDSDPRRMFRTCEELDQDPGE